eukprot:gene52135-69756_t
MCLVSLWNPPPVKHTCVTTSAPTVSTVVVSLIGVSPQASIGPALLSQ